MARLDAAVVEIEVLQEQLFVSLEAVEVDVDGVTVSELALTSFPAREAKGKIRPQCP